MWDELILYEQIQGTIKKLESDLRALREKCDCRESELAFVETLGFDLSPKHLCLLCKKQIQKKKEITEEEIRELILRSQTYLTEDTEQLELVVKYCLENGGFNYSELETPSYE